MVRMRKRSEFYLFHRLQVSLCHHVGGNGSTLEQIHIRAVIIVAKIAIISILINIALILIMINST